MAFFKKKSRGHGDSGLATGPGAVPGRYVDWQRDHPLAPGPSRMAWMPLVQLDSVARGTQFDGLVGPYVVGFAEAPDPSLPYATVAVDEVGDVQVAMVCQRGASGDHVLVIDSSGDTSVQGPLPAAESLGEWAQATVHVLLTYFSGPGRRDQHSSGGVARQTEADRPVAAEGARVRTAESRMYREFASRGASPSIDSYVVGHVVHRTEPPGGRIEIWTSILDPSMGQNAVNPIHTSHAAAAFDRQGRLVAIFTVETSQLHDKVFAIVYDGSPSRDYRDADDDVLSTEGFERTAVRALAQIMDSDRG